MSGSGWTRILLALYGVTLIAIAPTARDARGFDAGTDREGRRPGTLWLFSTIFIAWIFAKSVTNAANLGASLGLPGAVAYAAYWLSILVAGLVIHLLAADVRVSARRWQAEGPLRRMLKNWLLLIRYLSGTPPERLVARYPGQG